MIEENVYKLMLRIISILLLMIGGAIAIQIWLIWIKADKNLIKARIFLNEVFMRKSWYYIFTGTTFFAIDQVLVLLFGYYSEISILAEAFKVAFISLVVLVLIDYRQILKSCLR